MLQCSFPCNVNDTRALSCLCLLVTSHSGHIRNPWHRQAFTIAHIVIGPSLCIHSFIHLSSNRAYFWLVIPFQVPVATLFSMCSVPVDLVKSPIPKYTSQKHISYNKVYLHILECYQVVKIIAKPSFGNPFSISFQYLQHFLPCYMIMLL